jgi:hypothetical protein
MYALKTKDLYSKLLKVQPNTLLWRLEAVQMAESLKQSLITVTVLALPSFKKPFCLFFNIDKRKVPRVLTQEHGKKQPVAYLSKLLDPVTWG